MVSVVSETSSWFGFTKGLIEVGIQRLRLGQLGEEGKKDNLFWTEKGGPVVPIPNKCLFQDIATTGFSLARLRPLGGIDVAPLPGEVQTFSDAAEIARLHRLGELELPW